jgi:signal transduction histidine kinase
MKQGYAHTHVSLHKSADTRLHGSWLILVRAIVGVLLLLTLILFIVSLPASFAILHVPCSSGLCTSTSGQVTIKDIQVLRQYGISLNAYAIYWTALNVAIALGWFVVGGVLAWRKSDDWMALLSVLMLTSVGASFIISPTLTGPSIWQLSVNIWYPLNSLSILSILALFPNGRFAPRWIGWLLLLYPVQLACYLVFLHQLHLPGWSLYNNPINAIAWFGSLGVLALAQLYRYFRVSNQIERQQTKWVAFSFLMFFVASFADTAAENLLSIQQIGLLYVLVTSLLTCTPLVVPLAFGIAILRYRLWDIDIIINRALVYGALTLSIVGIYVLVVGYLGALFRSGSNLLISLIAAGLVAVLFQPLRVLLQRGANRLLYGQRDEPYAVITGLSRRLEATLAPDAVLSTIVQTVAQALKLPYVAILLKQEDIFTIAAQVGNEKVAPLTFPLLYQREVVGKLLLAPRAAGEDFTPADLDLLNELTRQIGLAAYAVRLTSDLQRSNEHLQSARARLVTAREEERRRLRRDLHDGLGSALTSVTFQLDAAGNLLDRNPDAVRTLLKELKGQIQVSIADIRRLVYNLRPPILDEWGLVGAIREQVAQYELNSVHVTVEASEPFPALPAAVEVAAYRIALEGLANVIKHAQATTCTIRLVVSNDALTVEVQDNGRGLPQNYHAGVGISAMRERAAELGGTCVMENVGDRATRVFAMLPRREE